MRTSYSALDTFRQCPQKFKFQEIDKIKAAKSAEAVFGSSVHSALKFMFSRDPLFPTIDQVLSDFSENWKNSAKSVASLLPELIQIYEESGKNLIKGFYKKNPPWNYSVVDTESRFEVLLPDPETQESHILAGIIDRIDKINDDEYEIIDYKTNRKLPYQEDVNKNLQMSLYHMAVSRRWPNINPAKIKLSLYFLKHGEKLSSWRDLTSLEETKQSVLKTIRQIKSNIENNDFAPNLSKLCDFCSYKPLCPAWKHLYKKENLFSPNEAELQTALKEYFLIKETEAANENRLKKLQNTIKNYMEANKVDRVFDERGYFVAKKLQQRFKYDLEKVREILLANGLKDKWEALLAADEKKLKSILDELPYLVRAQIASQKMLQKEFAVLTSSSKPAKK